MSLTSFSQRNAVQHSNPNMTLGAGTQVSDNPLYRDTQPLLGVQMVPTGAVPGAGMMAVAGGAAPQYLGAPAGAVMLAPSAAAQLRR